VCRSCHSLITLGLLEVTGNPLDGLTFTPKAAKLSAGLSSEREALAGMPPVTAAAPGAFRYLNGPEGDGVSGYPDGPALYRDETRAYEDAVLGLEALGWKKKEAPLRARRALDDLRTRGAEVTSESLIKEALRAPVGQRKAVSKE